MVRQMHTFQSSLPSDSKFSSSSPSLKMSSVVQKNRYPEVSDSSFTLLCSIAVTCVYEQNLCQTYILQTTNQRPSQCFTRHYIMQFCMQCPVIYVSIAHCPQPVAKNTLLEQNTISTYFIGYYQLGWRWHGPGYSVLFS